MLLVLLVLLMLLLVMAVCMGAREVALFAKMLWFGFPKLNPPIPVGAFAGGVLPNGVGGGGVFIGAEKRLMVFQMHTKDNML